MVAVNTPREHAAALADALVAADYRGHFSHGLNRLDMYVNEVRSGVADSAAKPVVVSERAATAHVDGRGALGPVVGNFCMNLAINKARSAGVGWVVAKGSNHYGIAGWYSMQASAVGLLGLSFTNTSPLVFPTRSKELYMGTNPITLAAPALRGDSFVLDMATTTVAFGKVEVNYRKGLPIPEGWGADKDGKVTSDPNKVLNDGGLLPLGGAEQTSGYKGYGLAMLVEIFCGILGDAAYANNIRRWKVCDRPANLGQCFIAVDPEAFAPGFQERLSDLLSRARQLDTSEGEPVLVAGDPEKAHMKRCDAAGGITYPSAMVNFLDRLAAELAVVKVARKPASPASS